LVNGWTQAVGAISGPAHVNQHGLGSYPASGIDQTYAVRHHARGWMGSTRHPDNAFLNINDHNRRGPGIQEKFAHHFLLFG
jgi:hypothetical protein